MRVLVSSVVRWGPEIPRNRSMYVITPRHPKPLSVSVILPSIVKTL
jgi:hypothetical protein